MKSDLLAELTEVLSDGFSQDLWLLSVGIDNNPWGQYQLFVRIIHTYIFFIQFSPLLSHLVLKNHFLADH